MAKKTIRKYNYRRKGKWSANIQSVGTQSVTLSPGNFYFSTTLASNPVQSVNTVSQQYTVKNFELSFSFDLGTGFNPELGTQIENVVFYIMYVPQGITIDNNLPLNHPEWIMSYKFMGSIDMESQGNSENQIYVGPKRGPYRIKTRMARRLQTGDSVVLLVTGYNDNSSTTIPGELYGLLRWWTKAN